MVRRERVREGSSSRRGVRNCEGVGSDPTGEDYEDGGEVEKEVRSTAQGVPR